MIVLLPIDQSYQVPYSTRRDRLGEAMLGICLVCSHGFSCVGVISILEIPDSGFFTKVE
jgi:hypothetical protein